MLKGAGPIGPWGDVFFFSSQKHIIKESPLKSKRIIS